MFKTAYTFGRFNIPHAGHAKIFEHLEYLGLEVIVGVSESSKNNPLELRLEALRKLYPGIEFRKGENAFFYPLDTDDVVVLGQDKERLARMISEYWGCSTFLIPRTSNDPSSTLCRKLIDSQDDERLYKMIPQGSLEISKKLRNYELSL